MPKHSQAMVMTKLLAILDEFAPEPIFLGDILVHQIKKVNSLPQLNVRS